VGCCGVPVELRVRRIVRKPCCEMGKPGQAMNPCVAPMTRVGGALSRDAGDPLAMLFGPGASDNFVGADYQERTLEQALWQALHDAGFQRVVFSSATSPWYCLDDESRNFFLGKLGNSGHHPPEALRERPVMRKNVQSRASDVAPAGAEDGRAGLNQTAHTAVPAAPGAAGSARHEQTLDNRVLALLNACLRVRDIPTALVIVRAGDYLRFNAADRDLADWFAQWQQVPAAVDNLCVLVFTERSLAGTIETITSLGYANALVPCLERQRSLPVGSGSGEITEPDAAEIKRVIHRSRLIDGLRVADWNEFDRIVAAFAAQPDVPVRNWIRRLRRLASEDVTLSLDEIRRQGWVESLPSGQSAWERLTELTGLAEVKEHVDRIRWRAEAEAKRRRDGRLREPGSLHMVFTGGPGTGKTTVARLIGELYREMGLLRRGHLHAPEASDLIGMYVGHTAVQTSAAVDAALDGVLFIDEAYRLSEAPGGYGQEAIDTLITRMDNERDRLVVVVAGYPDKMKAFLRSNPGLPRRFPRGNIIHFPDYEPDALLTILLGMLRDRALTWVPELEPVLRRVVAGMYRERDLETFGNAGEMRNLAQELETNWARRVQADVDEPVTAEDLPASYREFG
jgi:hypothetical protein